MGRSSVVPALLAPLASVALAAFVSLAGLPARAQGWNLYDSYTDTVRLTFNSPIPNPVLQGTTPTLNVSLGGQGAVPFTVDTGSTGMVVSNTYFNPAGYKLIQKNAAIPYTSSGNYPQGDLYEVPIVITDNNGNRVGSTVQVLVVNDGGSWAMMGVGFDRGGNTGANNTNANVPLYPGAAMNAFLNITSINGQAVSDTTMRKGYIVDQNGVRLGLTSDYTSNFTMVKLSRNTIAPSNVWNRAQMGVTVNNVPLGMGAFLPDTGIAYMILVRPESISNPPPTACPPSMPTSSRCLPAGTPVNVNLTPGLPQNVSTTLGFTATNEPTPGQQNIPPFVETQRPGPLDEDALTTPYSVNTGQSFYQSFDYLFDYVGGWVGYRAIAGQDFTVLLSLQDLVDLPGGFATTLPTYLAAATTLAPAGQSTFNAPFFGLGNNLTIAGPGTVTFNSLVNLAGGALNVQQGTASIAASLTASTVNIAAQGSLFNAAGSTITGNVANAGLLNNTGTISGNTVNTGMLAGIGTITGNLVQAGTIAPGNSIGTMTVNGAYTQVAGGTYQAEVNGAGQSDLISVGGVASLGGTVNVTALPGTTFAPRTTYTILNAAGGVNGTFASVTDLYPFLLSSLSYDPNNVYLTLQIGGFAAAAQTPTQFAVGQVLDANVNNASGDFVTVLEAMAVNTLSTAQGQATLQALSGNNYAGFSSAMVQGAMLFMNNFASQAGGGSPSGNRVALAEACDVACDTTSPAVWGAWGGGLGGLGTIGAGQPVGAVTYNVGGFAAGLDRQITPELRLGVTAGYSAGTQWVGGFDGKGTSDTVQAGLYGGFNRDKVYADAIVGYAYSYNQMWRNIAVPGLQPRTAQGRTGANQFYGQVEGGYRFDLGGAAEAFITPFARLQAYTGTQNAFTETGAQSLDLTVAQQTTNSLRSVLGAQLGGAMDLGWREKLAMQLRLGWSHEYADTARPVTATFAGAPVMPFTTFGVAPQRDGVVLGLAANTAIADAASIFVRYEGDISGQDSAHAITAGFRMTW